MVAIIKLRLRKKVKYNIGKEIQKFIDWFLIELGNECIR